MAKQLIYLLALVVLCSFVYASYSDFEQVKCNSGTGMYDANCYAYDDVAVRALNGTLAADISDNSNPSLVGGWHIATNPGWFAFDTAPKYDLTPANGQNGIFFSSASTDTRGICFNLSETATDTIFGFNFYDAYADNNLGFFVKFQPDSQGGYMFMKYNDDADGYWSNCDGSVKEIGKSSVGSHRGWIWYNSTNGKTHFKLDENISISLSCVDGNPFKEGRVICLSHVAYTVQWWNITYYNYTLYGFNPPFAAGGGGDVLKPSYTSLTNNASTVTKKGGVVNWSVTLTDETGLSGYIFANNDTGTLTNGSFTSLSGASSLADELVTITRTRGNSVCGQFWFNDSSNNINQTDLSCFTVANTAPTITLTSPADNDHNRINLTSVFTPDDADNDTTSCYLNINGSSVVNSSINWTVPTTMTMTGMTTDGSYSWNVTCNDSTVKTASAQRTYILDTTNPILTINSPINKTYFGFGFWINFTATDSNLYILNYSFINSTGNVLQSNQSLTTTLSYLSINDSVLIAGLSDGTYYINYSASDQHTKQAIKEYQVKQTDTSLIYDTEEGITVTIEILESKDKISRILTEKLEDRYSFTFELKESKKTTYRLKSSHPLLYLPSSSYKAHFITLNGIKGNWIDFQNKDLGIMDYNIMPVDDYTYDIFIDSEKDSLKFESIGGLNVVERRYEIYLDALGTPSWSNNKSNSSMLNGSVQMNVTLSDRVGLSSYIFSWNGTTNGWQNDSLTSISGLGFNVSINKSMNLTRPNIVSWTVYFNDTNSNKNQTSIFTFAVLNTPPIVSDIAWKTAGGFTSGTRSYGQTIAEINATCQEMADHDLIGCNVSIIDPDGLKALDNKQMSNISERYNYTTSVELNKVGTWVINVSAYDGADITSSTTNVVVAISTPSVFDGIYAYDYGILLNQSTILSEISSYGYDTIGQQINLSTFNSTFESLNTYMNFSKTNLSVKTFVALNFDYGSYDPTDGFTNYTCDLVNQNLTKWKIYPFDEAIQFILIKLNESKEYRTNFTNSIAECIVNATANKFPVYVDYSNSSLDNNWVSTYSLINVTAVDNTTYINQENMLLKTRSSLTRIYFNLSTDTKNTVKLYHDYIITKIRGTPSLASTSNSSVAKISNGDYVIFNNLSTASTLIYNISNNSDVWDSTQKTYIESDSDGIINVTIPAYSFVNLYLDNIDHFTLSSVYSSSTTGDRTYGWNKTGNEIISSYSIVSANDAMFYAFDPSYGHNNQFFVDYGWINTSRVTNASPYCNNGVMIIADKSQDGINSIGCNSSLFGYISVANYQDNDEWEANLTAQIDDWINNYHTSIFLDGLDTAITGNNFASRFRNGANYIMIDKNSSCITNDYTSYATAGVGGICNYDMKESFCGRWDGTVGSPTYSFEDFNTDLLRAEWARTNGNKQVLQAFGNPNDIDKVQYCYAEYLVLFGNANNLYNYGQPTFQGQEQIFTFDAGTQLENTWTKVNDSYYSRKYSNGLVWFNPTTHDWNIENNRQINNMTLAIAAQVYAVSPAQSTPINVQVNEYSVAAITYDEIGAVQWATNTIYRNISAFYNKSGRYAIRLSSQVAGNPAGLNIMNSKANSTGIFSFYENSVTNPPAIDGTWTAYGRSGVNDDLATINWMINIVLNDTTSAQIDNGITNITQTNKSGVKYTNITFSSTKSFPVEIWGEPVTLSFNPVNLTYWNGTIWKNLSLLQTTTCDSINPLFASSSIDGQTHKACIQNNSGTYKVRVAVPSLSTKIYSLDNGADITPPTYTNFINNASTTTRLNDRINWSINVSDTNFAPTYSFLFAHNLSGTLTNSSTSMVVYGYTDYTIITVDVLVNRTRGNYICGQFWLNDTSGNVNQTLLTESGACFTVANTIPSTPAITYPLNNRYYSNIGYINFSSTDADADALTYSIFINKTLNITTATNVIQWNASDGYYKLEVGADDGYNRSSNTTLHFVLDTTMPTISTLVNMSIDSSTPFYTDDNIYVNATITDSFGVNTSIASWNDSSGVWHNETSNRNGNVYSWIVTSSNLSSSGGKWLSWIYYANDSAGNMQTSAITSYYVNILPIEESESDESSSSSSEYIPLYADKPICGDNTCDLNETITCPNDCKVPVNQTTPPTIQKEILTKIQKKAIVISAVIVVVLLTFFVIIVEVMNRKN